MLERIHLAIVQTVEKQGSLTAAADVLCLTQSALSHSMKKLEIQLGTPIWLRENRRLRLTQAGQYVLAVANRVLPQLALAEQRMCQFAQGANAAPPDEWQLAQATLQGAGAAEFDGHAQLSQLFDHFLQGVACRVLLVGQAQYGGI